MSTAASQQQVRPVPRHYGVGKRRLVDFSIEFIKYLVLIPLTFSFAFPLYWMVSSALKVDSQVFTVPPILVPIPAHPENFVNAWQVLPFTQLRGQLHLSLYRSGRALHAAVFNDCRLRFFPYPLAGTGHALLGSGR